MNDDVFMLSLMAFLRHEEGLMLWPYQCEAGKWTIGYGHLCKRSQRPISPEEAQAFLLADIAEARKAVDVLPLLSVGQRVAVVSFAFNVGVSAFRESTMFRKLFAGDVVGAADEFGRWVYVTKGSEKVVSKGLAARRSRERDLFLGVV